MSPFPLSLAVLFLSTRVFSLSNRDRLKIEMKIAPSFLGYSRLAAETTAHSLDQREQIDLSTPHPLPGPSDPIYHNLRAPTLWPSPTHLPEFRPIYEDYIARMAAVSMFFTTLIAESIGLPADAFDQYFDRDQQHKLKIIKYPDLLSLGYPPGTQGQGVGPHKDSMLSSYLLQATNHRGLQVQNSAGEWIDCPPIPGTLVVAIGQGMEAITQGVCASTTHRVLSPEAGSGARFSVPFFQGIGLDARFDGISMPEELKKLRDDIARREGRVERGDKVENGFKLGRWKTLGEATLMNRVKSHPDVGERWYPELLNLVREMEREEQEAKDQ
jgi:isopenicillin N synthase-like dioxygenase